MRARLPPRYRLGATGWRGRMSAMRLLVLGDRWERSIASGFGNSAALAFALSYLVNVYLRVARRTLSDSCLQ